jgi:hypothetical protein
MARYANDLIRVAKAEEGYLEKKSNAYLNSKSKNAGSNNYTKYGAWYGLNPAYWCAEYVSWCVYKAFGDCKIMYGKSASCETIRQRFKDHKRYGKTPKEGAFIFFSGSRHPGAVHIGIVTRVSGDTVYTMEGNTNADKGVVDNGGAVNNKAYKKSYSKILGYGYPEYDTPKKNTTVKASAKTGKVTASALNVRKQPSVLAGKCTFSPLKKGAVVKIVTAQKGWYLIEYKGKRGYVSSKYIKKV